MGRGRSHHRVLGQQTARPLSQLPGGQLGANGVGRVHRAGGGQVEGTVAMKRLTAAFLTGVASVLLVGATVRRLPQAKPSLWAAYDQSLRPAKYVDLTH